MISIQVGKKCKDSTVKSMERLQAHTINPSPSAQYHRRNIGTGALLGLGISLLALSSGPLPVHAQANDPNTTQSSTDQTAQSISERSSTSDSQAESSASNRTVQLGVIPFVPPPEESAPRTTLGGGRRNNQCTNTAYVSSTTDSTTNSRTQLAALTPPDGTIGLTEQAKPTLWVYQPNPSIRSIVLSVREEASQEFHSQTTIQLPTNPDPSHTTPNSQWVPLQLADDAPPLEPGVNYLWAAIALCGENPTPNDPLISARMRRIEPSSSSSEPAQSIALAEQFARQGQWYDTVDTLMQLPPSATSATETDLAGTWQALLDYSGLGPVASPLSPQGN